MQPTTIALWLNGAPGSESWTQHEQESLIPPSLKVVRNVAQPTLTVYLPDPQKANGTAVIVCPGGAFHFLSIDMEGTDVAHWLNARGIAAFVLKYRLVRTGDNFPAEVWENMKDEEQMLSVTAPIVPMATADGNEAIRLVRTRASEWGVNPDRIGIMGFSAGGSVATNVALVHDADSRPNFAAPIYTGPYLHKPVPADAPPLFLLCANDDEMAVKNNLSLYTEWRAAGNPVELHIYAQGGHGFGMNQHGVPADTWIERFAEWLGDLGMTNKH
jgi:acetyl esterase/lipase